MRKGKLASGFWGPDFARRGHRAGTKRHEQEQARRKKARETPGHPLREPFKYAKRVERQALAMHFKEAFITLGPSLSISVSEVSLTAQDGVRELRRFAGHMDRVSSGGAPLARHS